MQVNYQRKVPNLDTSHSTPVELPARGVPAFDKKFIQGPSKGRYITSAVSGFWFLICLVPGFQDFVK